MVWETPETSENTRKDGAVALSPLRKSRQEETLRPRQKPDFRPSILRPMILTPGLRGWRRARHRTGEQRSRCRRDGLSRSCRKMGRMGGVVCRVDRERPTPILLPSPRARRGVRTPTAPARGAPSSHPVDGAVRALRAQGLGNHPASFRASAFADEGFPVAAPLSLAPKLGRVSFGGGLIDRASKLGQPPVGSGHGDPEAFVVLSRLPHVPCVDLGCGR